MLKPSKSFFRTVFTTPATASAPYIAEAPSFKISTLSTPPIGILFEFTDITGTKLPPIASV